VLSKDVSDFMTYQGTNTYIKFLITDFDSRAILGNLLNTDYYINSNGLEAYIPYGYSQTSYTNTLSKTYTAYKNDYALPFGYTYSGCISKEQYEALSILQRQQALMQGAVIENEQAAATLNPVSPQDCSSPLKIKSIEGVSGVAAVKANEFTVLGTNAKIAITLEAPPPQDGENYFVITGLKHEPFEGVKLAKRNHTWISMSVLQKRELEEEERNPSRPKYRTTTIRVSTDDGYTGRMCIPIPRMDEYIDTQYDFGKQDYVQKLGKLDQQSNTVTLTFDTAGIYSFSNLQLVHQPLDSWYETAVEKMSEYSLQNLKLGTDSLSGSITVDEPRLLCLSIPYSTGWKAYVNGKETKTIKTNTMFIGLLLEKGSYDIQLKYRTPWLNLGLIISAAGFSLLGLIILFNRKRRRLI
jgi:uncharacterized membrane protein YfhO